MENEKRKVLLEEAKKMKGTAKNINTILLPKLRKFKDAFTPSEWHIIELAVDNYIIDMTSEATRLQVTAQQNLS
jgi:hypothetical protein